MIAILTPYIDKIEAHCRGTIDILRDELGAKWYGCRNGLGHLAKVRNDIIRRVPRAEWYLWLDSDVAVTAEDVRIAISSGERVIGLSMPYEHKPGVAAGNWVGGVPGRINTSGLTVTNSKSVNPVDWVSAGLVLVHRSVYDTLSQPWYRYAWVDGAFDQSSEGIGFCIHCQDAGISVHNLATTETIHQKGVKMAEDKHPKAIVDMTDEELDNLGDALSEQVGILKAKRHSVREEVARRLRAERQTRQDVQVKKAAKKKT